MRSSYSNDKSFDDGNGSIFIETTQKQYGLGVAAI